MKKSVLAEFEGHRPKAIVLDDSTTARRMTARKLRAKGFHVDECATVKSFKDVWAPGMFDLIVADWQLSQLVSEHGDKVLVAVRARDWDVPFVLVSGKLGEDDRRAKVLQKLLEQGQARFVRRGTNGISKVCDEAEELIERRDSTLLKLILSLREAATKGSTIKTTTGQDESVLDQLAELVASPRDSHATIRPLAKVRSKVVAKSAG